ncbi:MAG: cysteine--tRNA ligase [Ruthenibacterium sp.]
MQVFNTLTRRKEELKPIMPGNFRIYVCGPTVYNYIHIGNARPVVVFDTLRRYLEYRGNKVRFVSNITDIDDKLITKANEEGVSMQEVARRYEAEFLKDCGGLNVLPPTVRPRATEHIDEILSIVADIIEKGYGYVAKNGDVYFRARKFKEYGKLSHLNLDELESGNRSLRHTMEDDLKEDPADFAVWKAAKPGEPYWDSPYGPGRPGWHIECSAMARKHLGETIDIHAGGEDLIFPHHENEIAQSECANGCEFAHYWMHNAFLNIDNRKMSKSAGNFFTVREIAQKYGYEPIRYFMLTAQYRSPLNYTVELIEACRSALERLYTCRENLDFALQNAKGESEALTVKARFAREKFCEAMDDDLNTPDALAAIFDFVRDANTLASDASKGALEEAAAVFDELTGVLGIVQHREKEAVPADVMALVAARAEAKKAKDWARADALRAEIGEKGYAVEDTPQGPKVLKK